MMSEHHLDLAVLQEVRVSKDSAPAMEQAFAKQGMRWVQAPEMRDINGKVMGGVAFVSSWPIQQVATPEQLDPRRFLLVAAHRPQQRPLLCVGLYMHASSKQQRVADFEGLMTFLAACKEDVVVIGD